jgi:tRNA pseudouridine55 synthase
MSRDASRPGDDVRSLVSEHPELPVSWESAVLLVDKPKGMTSFDVIRVLRRATGIRRMGHAGTLDPMATGLLIILVGRSTKRMRDFMEMPKSYAGVIRLGEETPSFDAETEVIRRRDPAGVTTADLESARLRFLGPITQRTPSYSAVKVGGERLYRKARRGERVTTPDRHVTIDRFDLVAWSPPEVTIEVDCSKGTYIRSLAHEFGEALGVGGHLVALRRTGIGPFAVERAWPLGELESRLPGRGGE